MKKQFLNLFLGLAVVAVSLSSCSKKSTDDGTTDPKPNTEFLASTTPSNRIALLEDFTGVRCQYCPDGHVRAKAILDANPGKFIVIATHAGSYATPSTGWANFTTAAGTAINNQAKPAGYPAGTMNRATCTSLGVNPMSASLSPITMDRGQWAAAAAKVMTMPAPVNIGAKATFDAATRLLTVKVDLYYTATETVPNNLNISLLQSGLVSKQSGGTPDANAYVQNHVLRTMISGGNWGDAITEATAAGTKISKTYTYTVPADYNGTAVEGGGAVVIDNLSVVVFVSRGQLEIINALEVDVK